MQSMLPGEIPDKVMVIGIPLRHAQSMMPNPSARCSRRSQIPKSFHWSPLPYRLIPRLLEKVVIPRIAKDMDTASAITDRLRWTAGVTAKVLEARCRSPVFSVKTFMQKRMVIPPRKDVDAVRTQE